MIDEELDDLSYSAYEEALSYGLSRDVFVRYFRIIRDRSAASKEAPAAIDPSIPPLPDVATKGAE
jgi:hypothetical protein